MRTAQITIVDLVIEHLPKLEDWIGFMNRLAHALYPTDLVLSGQCARMGGSVDYFLGDLACLDPRGLLTRPVSARAALDFKDSTINVHELLSMLTRVDQILGRRRFLELTDAA